MAVRAVLAALPVLGVDKLGGRIAVCFEGAEHVVVDLPEEDPASICSGRVVARQMNASNYTGFIISAVFVRYLEAGVLFRHVGADNGINSLASYTVA